MEEVENPVKTTCSLCCETESCNMQTIYDCRNYNQALCSKCKIDTHEKCKCDQRSDYQDVVESLDIAKALLALAQKNSNLFDANSDIKTFDEDIKMFQDIIANAGENLKNSSESNETHEFNSIMKEVLQLQRTLIDSSLLINFSKLNELKQALAENRLSCQMVADMHTNSSESILTHSKDSVPNEIDTTNEHSKKTTKEFESNDNDKINIKLNEVYPYQTNVEEQKNTTSFEVAEENNQREELLLQQELELQSVVFNRIYQRNTGEEVPDISSFNLKISLNEEEHNALIMDFVKSKIRLPQINEIQISHLRDGNVKLNKFLRNCAPSTLDMLAINNYSTVEIGIKSKFYIRSLSKVATIPTKIIYFNCIEFREKDLQLIIRAAHNTERIMFNYCSIHCSSNLDFGADLKYNTWFLSFQGCGSIHSSELTTYWISKPSCFSHIVDAIGRSGLRESLKRVNIAYNSSLDITKVQEMFDTKGMPHISAVLEYL